MNTHLRMKDRIATLRARRNDESGYSLIDMILIISVMVTLVTVVIIAVSGLMGDDQRNTIEKEALITHDAIWSDYIKMSKGLEEREDLKEALKEATEKYVVACDDKNTKVRSVLVDSDTISVSVTRRDEGRLNPEVLGTFTTGDKNPESQVVKDTIKNDNQILEFDNGTSPS